ncbi:helix-turn-helix domain-containing protein [Geodermatophilus arenarius]|uniref:Helix-turn-helix domain-containing protein n=1 Tax=Geodermatophilus arenarius TaxID=1137990 RepID=A0ABV9LEB3_9ACTN
MATLVDTDALAAADRRPARVADLLEATMSSRIRFPDPSAPARARLDGWDLAGVSVLRLDLTGEVTLLRTARHARADSEPVLSLAVQEAGTARQEQFGSRRLVAAGELSFSEVSSPYEYAWSGRGVCRALRIPAASLGLPIDTVRRALPVAARSPLHGLVRAHVTRLTRDVALLAAEPLVHSLASATVDLARALLASAADGARGADDVLGETLPARVRGYVRRHLTEPDLDAERIARAHAVSVRQLYRICAAAGFSLEQEVIAQRLEGARAELARPGDRSIAAVARRWGFTDASYFARRFRAGYGVSPREWRDRSRAGAAAG